MKKKDTEQKVNIQNSNLDKSPVIVNSQGASIYNCNRKVVESLKNKKNILSNPWFITIVGGIIVGVILLFVLGENKMGKKDTKVNIQDSNIKRSPIIVDSPGASVDNSVSINSTPEDFQKLILVKEEDTKLNDGLWKKSMTFGSEYGMALSNIELKLKFDSEINNFKSFIKGVGFVQRGTFSSKISEDKKEYFHAESILNSNNFLVIEITSKNPSKLIFEKNQRGQE